MSLVLEMKGLTKSYGNIMALDNLNLDIKKGEILGLLGPNGSGKTTTLAIILSILKADKGSFEWFEGKYGLNPRRHIGAILETPNFYTYKSGLDNLKVIAMIKGIKDFDYDSVMKLVNLEHRQNSKFRTYSLGMKQRLAIAATMIGNPEIVIFDEPTNGLDPKGIAEVRNILKRVAESGRTVLIASHILDEVEKICSHVAIIKKGKLLAKGIVGELLSKDYFVEINALESEKLMEIANKLDFIKSAKKENDFWLWRIEHNIPAAMISKILQDNKITVSHFLIRKQSLEEEFLEITKN